jgi:hypothetical protein
MSRRPQDPGGETAGIEEGLVQRWSRRKAEVSRSESAPREQSGPPPAEPAKALTDADMPPIESLNEKSDYSPFLSPGVSEELRRLAFRRLFRLPEFNQRFELDSEYYDCTSLEPLGSIVTHDMREEMKRAAEKLAETLKEPPQQGENSAATATTAEAVAAPPAEARAPGVTAAAAPAAAKTTKPRAGRRTRSRRKA